MRIPGTSFVTCRNSCGKGKYAPVQDVKAYGKVHVYPYSFLDLVWLEVINGHLHPQTSLTPLHTEGEQLGWPKERSERFDRVKHFLASDGKGKLLRMHSL